MSIFKVRKLRPCHQRRVTELRLKPGLPDTRRLLSLQPTSLRPQEATSQGRALGGQVCGPSPWLCLHAGAGL